MERIDVAIIGGGVVGLATACAVVTRGRSVCLLERKPRPGLEQSTHNSGIIHAGIYYPQDSLKARLCIEGREALYRFCSRHDVPHRRVGKLIVAGSEEDRPALEALATRGTRHGVDDLEIVDRAFIRRREPHVESPAAIWSPSTGIIEAETYVRTLARLAAAGDVAMLVGTELSGGVLHRRGIEIETANERILARTVVNAAGLYADEVSSALGGEDFTIYPVRGDYAELAPAARHLVNGPVYPLPDRSGHSLGVHLTPTTWGTVTLGPTARYQTARDDYESDRVPLAQFFESARRLLPTIAPGDLQAGGSGIRARAGARDVPFADFIIRHDPDVPGLIQAAGIDSPGLTASLAIADLVADLVDEVLAG